MALYRFWLWRFVSYHWKRWHRPRRLIEAGPGRRASVGRDWSYLGYNLARFGIASDVEYAAAGDYGVDPWRPAPNVEVVRVTLSLEDASKLSALLDDAFEEV